MFYLCTLVCTKKFHNWQQYLKLIQLVVVLYLGTADLNLDILKINEENICYQIDTAVTPPLLHDPFSRSSITSSRSGT